MAIEVKKIISGHRYARTSWLSKGQEDSNAESCGNGNTGMQPVIPLGFAAYHRGGECKNYVFYSSTSLLMWCCFSAGSLSLSKFSTKDSFLIVSTIYITTICTFVAFFFYILNNYRMAPWAIPFRKFNACFCHYFSIRIVVVLHDQYFSGKNILYLVILNL